MKETPYAFQKLRKSKVWGERSVNQGIADPGIERRVFCSACRLLPQVPNFRTAKIAPLNPLVCNPLVHGALQSQPSSTHMLDATDANYLAGSAPSYVGFREPMAEHIPTTSLAFTCYLYMGRFT